MEQICDICGEKKLVKLYYKRKLCLTCHPENKQMKKVNVNYRLKKLLAGRMRSVITKTNNTMAYIGCNIQYLREWIEYNFTPEMNWDNYGVYWSIEHVIPIDRFDLSKDDDKMRCWNWSNLVPIECNNKDIDTNNIIQRLETFKEEGSTTKWFSGEFILKKMGSS